MSENNKTLSMEVIKKFIDQLNEGSISYADLPEPFQTKKDKIRIPIKPVEPSIDECCGTGCRPCVFDIYESKLEKYEENLDRLTKELNLSISGSSI